MQIVKYFGPPGTGKTSLLLNLIEKELEAGVEPQRIAYLSFTNAACDEAVGRAIEKFGLSRRAFKWFSTIHSVCYRLLNISKPQLIRGPKDLGEFSRLVGVPFSVKRSYTEADDFDFGGSGTGNRLLEFDHYRRSRLQSAHDAYAEWPEPVGYLEMERFVKAYELYREDEGLVDFTDLLEKITEPLDVDIIFVDEAQDLSKLQWRALGILARNVKKMVIAGDDDQAIFTWAGADPTALINHPGETKVLNQSYRLPRAVYEVATRIVKNLPDRQAKEWAPRPVEGKLGYTLHAEAALDAIPPTGSVLVLYRSHYQMRGVENHLRGQGIPYQTIWGPGRGLQWAPAIIAWERLRAAKKPVTAEEALVAIKARKLEDRTLIRKIEGMPQDLVVTFQMLGMESEQAPWYAALERIGYHDRRYLRNLLQYFGPAALRDTPRIKLSTIHSAKGAEADHVILMTEMSKRCKALLHQFPGAEERVFYVGATRAKESMVIAGHGNPLFPIGLIP